MTGPEHYKIAELLLRGAADRLSPEQENRQLHYASVHATLALAAATALNHVADLTPFGSTGPHEGWREVVS